MSDFVVSARKYRPIRFDEVVGQQHVSLTLKNALKSNHLAHAFLFCGPRGVGKTTCARILAKVLNCQNITEDHEPCNTCNSCQSFNDNASFNITELDAASNNSVEHIRALIEQVRFQPQQGKYKIFIIDEVHMLSTQAFNAFLKTLEEPPPYAKFILATTEKHKILPTILSRCQIFDFNRIQVPDMVSHLQNICEEESISAEVDALHIIAQKADGALRDALSIFDRIVSFSSKTIAYNDVITNLNVLDYDFYFKVVDAFLSENVSQILLIFDEILRKGFDADVFINGLAEHLRNILVSKDSATLQLLEVSEKLRQKYAQQATLSPLSLLLSALSIANDCDVNYRMARNKRLHVEMALIKMTYIQRATQAAANNTNTASTEKKTVELTNTPPTKSVTAPKSEISQVEEPVVKLETAQNDISKIKTGIKLSGSKLSPTIRLSSLKSIEAEVLKQEKSEEIQSLELNDENLMKAWNSFTDTLSSKMVQNAFKNTKVKFKGETVYILAASEYIKSTIQQEREMLTHIKNYLNAPQLLLEIDVSETAKQVIKKPRKPLTPREKYKAMRDSNPLLDDIQKRFGLFPE